MAQFRQSGSERDIPVLSHPHGSAAATGRPRRPRRHGKAPFRVTAGALAMIVALALLVTFSAHLLLSRYGETGSRLDNENVRRKLEPRLRLNGAIPRVLGFGKGSSNAGRDSRFWDRDDRRRDRDYVEDDEELPGDGRRTSENENVGRRRSHSADHGGRSGSAGLYDEGGRAELDSYREESEDSLNKGGKFGVNDGVLEDDVDGGDYDYDFVYQDDDNDEELDREGKSGGDAITDRLKKGSSVTHGKGHGDSDK